MKRLAVAAGIVLLASAPAAEAQDGPQPESMVGIYVDAETNGATTASVRCRGYELDGPEGDLTLFIANQPPQTMTCVITIREAG